MRTPSVLHVITKLDVGGAQTHLVELVLGQVEAGYEVGVVAGRTGPATEHLRDAGVPVRVAAELADAHGRLSLRRAVAEVADSIRQVRPELVHGHSSHGGLTARLAARRVRVPSVYTAHGWPFQRGAAARQRGMSFVGEFIGGHVGDAVIVLTEAERQLALRARVVSARRVFVVPNGIADVPPELRRSRSDWDDRRPTMVMVARFAPPKQQADLIRIAETLTDLPWTLRMVGDGPELTECAGIVATSPSLSDRVEFLGERDDVAVVLAESDIGILWSKYEGLPMSVMEYMRAGLCSVTSDLPGTRVLLGDGAAGVLADTAADLATRLRELLSDRPLLDDFGTAARERFVSSYTREAMVAATETVYATVLSRR